MQIPFFFFNVSFNFMVLGCSLLALKDYIIPPFCEAQIRKPAQSKCINTREESIILTQKRRWKVKMPICKKCGEEMELCNDSIPSESAPMIFECGECGHKKTVAPSFDSDGVMHIYDSDFPKEEF